MICMRIGEALEATSSTLVAGDANGSFCGVTIDSRMVSEGICFVAFRGERVDGNDYLGQAIEKGAALVVATSEVPDEVSELACARGACVLRAADDDGEQFMLALAGAWRRMNPQWLVVGVTGSCGKTTTKELLAAGISSQRRCHATSGNFNNLIGVPLTLFAASADDEVLVVEMGMNNAGELERISACASPCVAVITNVGTSHIGNLGSREGIARAKAEVIGGLEGVESVPAHVVLTASDDFTPFIRREFCDGVRVSEVGTQGTDVWAEDVVLDDSGRAAFALVVKDIEERLETRLSIPGTAAVKDLESACGAIRALGLDVKKALEAMAELAPHAMRLDVRQKSGTPKVIDDSYNASPASMASALDVLCRIACDGRRVAVLGEMGELGDDGVRLHAMVGAYVAAKGVDMAVFVGTELATVMREAALTMGYPASNVRCFCDAEAACALVSELSERDVVLVKASRAVGLDRVSREVLGS